MDELPPIAGVPQIAVESLGKACDERAGTLRANGPDGTSNGAITSPVLAHPEVDEVFDDLDEIVLKICGEVIVVPTDRMPTDSGTAAIYCY